MAHNRIEVAAPREQVYALIEDGWRFADWVVGSYEVRSVEPEWPATGSGFHHTVGLRFLPLKDRTWIEERDPPRRLVLQARAWPLGRARVTLELTPVGDDESRCRVDMHEDPVAGPARYVPRMLRDPLTLGRNAESLRRLRSLARARSG